MATSSWRGSSAYDALYDPRTARTVGRGSDYAPAYWIATARELLEDGGLVTSDMDVDVAVIGFAYTGLNCPIALARDHGMQLVVLPGSDHARLRAHVGGADTRHLDVAGRTAVCGSMSFEHGISPIWGVRAVPPVSDEGTSK